MSTRWTQSDVDRVQAYRKGVSNEIERYLKGKPSKYGNRKTNGYASKREAKRAQELKALQDAGKIVNLREQVTYELIPKQNGERACKYIADFVYREIPDDPHVAMRRDTVEDVKGYRDPIYRIKRKLMLSVHGIRIREV